VVAIGHWRGVRAQKEEHLSRWGEHLFEFFNNIGNVCAHQESCSCCTPPCFVKGFDVAAKIVFRFSDTFQDVVIFGGGNKGHRVSTEDQKIIHIGSNIFVVIATFFNPEVGIGEGRMKAEAAKLSSEVFMEANSTGVETIKALIDDETSTVKGAKFRTSNNVDFLAGFAIQKSIANVGSTTLESVKVGKHKTHVDSLKTSHTRVYVFVWWVSVITTCNQSSFVP